jgi:hypothetical protein
MGAALYISSLVDPRFFSQRDSILNANFGVHVSFIDNMIRYMIYLLTAIGFTPGGSITVHIYTQTIHRTTQITERHK